MVGTWHKVSAKHLPAYLDEMCFLFNNRKNPYLFLDTILKLIPITGNPKPRLISTSHIERQNLTIRMQLRRFTRLTNAFSKKLENMKAALSLHFAWYNFCRIHSTLRVTPAMAGGISDRVWDTKELIAV